ncbi:hypothetical protein, partial [Schleiferia thermophila]
FLFACNKGMWVTKNAYRPKHPKFSIPKEPFKANELINNHLLYVSTKKFVNYDGSVVIGYMGFYSDGRMIIDNTWEKEMSQTLNERNSFNTASSIGYYTTNGNTIKMEYFLPGDGGRYETREGIIKKDTIILIEKIPQPLRKEIRSDTLVKSSYPLQDN